MGSSAINSLKKRLSIEGFSALKLCEGPPKVYLINLEVKHFRHQATETQKK